jgi:hypothetical protein
MTLDVLHFIDKKGGNSQEIRDSQKKRGLSVELVDEVIAMYEEWVKSMLLLSCLRQLGLDFLRQWILMPTHWQSKSTRSRRRSARRRRHVSSYMFSVHL